MMLADPTSKLMDSVFSTRYIFYVEMSAVLSTKIIVYVAAVSISYDAN